ncbi:nucleoporin subcomplex protein binding to Pom34-domain-containing protein [Paraphysoderma sedebokerense]|nr:nucleoporin subcomplex protein binding to Pom34-domain-containing protein [Paraphysoderma sedebokerense]
MLSNTNTAAAEVMGISQLYASTKTKLADTLTAQNTDCSVEDMVKLLNDNYDWISIGLEYFKPSSASSRSQISKDKVTSKGQSVALKNGEYQFILNVSDLLGLDEVQCFQLIRSYISEYIKSDGKEEDIEYSSSLLMPIVNHYFSERESVLRMISELFRTADDVGHVYQSAAGSIVEKLCSNDQFSNRLFQQFKELVKGKIPKNMEVSTKMAKRWIVQNLREQKRMLDCLILLHYLRVPCPPRRAVELIDFFVQNRFGLRQINNRFNDNEAFLLIQRIYYCAVILSIEIFDLETLLLPFTLSTSPKNSSIVDSPNAIIQLGAIFDNIANQPDEFFGPPLLLWSLFCCRLDAIMSESDCPASYLEVSNCITLEKGTNYRAKMAKAYQYNAVDAIVLLLKSDLVSPEESYNVAYRSIIKGLFNLLLTACQASSLPGYESLVDWMCLVYDNEPSLTREFWESDRRFASHSSLLDIARSRFPAEISPFVRILTSLIGDETTAQYALDYSSCVPTFTVSDSALDFEPLGNTAERLIRLRGKREGMNYDYMFCALIPPGTCGKIVSARTGIPPVVIQWSVEYPLILFCMSLLESFLAKSPETTEHSMSDVTDIVTFIKQLFLHGKVKDVISRLNDYPPIPEQNFYPDLPSQICRLLQYIIPLNPPAKLIAGSMQCFKFLFQVTPSDLWNFLRRSYIVPPSSNTYAPNHLQNIFQRVEIVSGQYPITRAWLELVDTLIEESLYSGYSDDLTSLQEHILMSCLNYILNDIFPTYDTWRYSSLFERFKVGATILLILLKSLNHPRLSSLLTSSLQTFVQITKIIRSGQELMNALFEKGKFREGEQVQELIYASFKLLQSLLERRKAVQSYAWVVEQVILNRSFGKEKEEFIPMIANYISYKYDDRFPVIAAKTLKYIIQSVTEMQSAPSALVDYLGDTAHVAQRFKSCLSNSKSSVELRIAIWELIATIVELQPGLASSYFLQSQSGNGKVAFEQSVLQTITANLDPSSGNHLNASILELLDNIWTNASDYHMPVNYLRKADWLWDKVEAILLLPFSAADDIAPVLNKTPEDEVISSNDTKVKNICYDFVCRAYALRILACEVSYANIERNDRVLKLLKNLMENKLVSWLVDFTSLSFNEKNQQHLLSLVSRLPVRIDLQHYKNDMLRNYGQSYIYNLNRLSKKLRKSYISHDNSLAEVLTQLVEVNYNWSIADAQTVLIRSWCQFVQVGFTRAAKPLQVILKKGFKADNVGYVFTSKLADTIALFYKHENAVTKPLISELETLLVVTIHLVSKEQIMSRGQLVQLMSELVIMVPSYDDIAEIDLLQLFTCILLVLKAIALSEVKDTGEYSKKLRDSCLSLLPIVVRSFTAASDARLDGSNFRILISLLGQLVQPSANPHSSLWIPIFQKSNIFQSLMVALTRSLSVPHTEKPIIALDLLHLLHILATMPAAAEQLVSMGIMPCLMSNSLTPTLTAGTLQPYFGQSYEKNPWHDVWLMMLSVTSSLISSLNAVSGGDHFVEGIEGFVRLYQTQIERSLDLIRLGTITTSQLREIEELSILYRHISHYFVTTGREVNGSLQILTQACLYLLHTSVYLLQHPQQLSSISIPMSREEKVEHSTSVKASEPPPSQRTSFTPSQPSASLEMTQFVFRVQSHLMLIIRNIVHGLSYVSHSTSIFIKTDYKPQYAILEPSFKISTTTFASLGTLFELLSFLARSFLSPPDFGSVFKLVCSSSEIHSVAIETMEVSLLLLVTQIYLYRHCHDLTTPENLAEITIEKNTNMELLERTVNGLIDSKLKGTEVLTKFKNQWMPLLRSWS